MSSPPPTARTSSRRVLLLVVALVLAVLVTGLVVWLQRDDRPRAEPGEQVGVRDGSHVAGYPVDVLLPFGRFRLTVGEAREELPSPCCTDEPADLRAPDGGSFVGIEITSDPISAVADARALVATPGAAPPDPVLTLLVGGGFGDGAPVEYPVDSFDGWWEGTRVVAPRHLAYVAVDGVPEADEISVRVEFDGVAQVVEPDDLRVDRGAAEGLYQRTFLDESGACGTVRLPAGFSSSRPPDCGAERRVVPYVAGLGWAGEGRAWLVVITATDPYVSLARRGPGGPYGYSTGSAAAPAPTLALAGRQPDHTWTVDGARLAAAFAVDPLELFGTTLTTTVRYDLDTDDPRPPSAVEIRWRRTL